MGLETIILAPLLFGVRVSAAISVVRNERNMTETKCREYNLGASNKCSERGNERTKR